MPKFRGDLLARICAAAMAFAGAPGITAEGETWLLIDTGELTLSVMKDQEVLHRFPNVAIGRNGATNKKRSGDQRTPLGSFRVSRIHESERYYWFIGLDYPDLEYARRALADGAIEPDHYETIRRAHEEGREPTAETPLGGYIGIHGIGDGDPRIHEEFNWTEGCVALTNEEIDQLLHWVEPQMVVVIL